MEDDDLPPDLMGNDFIGEPEGFGDPFANPGDPFAGAGDPFASGGDPFLAYNQPPASNGGLFSNKDAFMSVDSPSQPAPVRGGPPPPPPAFGNLRSGSMPPPPPPPPAFAANQRAQSDAHLPGFLQDINRLKLEKDAEAQLVGDPSEAGSFYEPNMRAPQSRGPQPGNYNQGRDNQNDLFNDPLADESIFMSGNQNKNKGGLAPPPQRQKGLFDESMMGDKSMLGDRRGLFDETMNQDMSMSMDQDMNKNNLSRLFDTGGFGRQSNNDEQILRPLKEPSGKQGGNLFDKIEEDEEEDKEDEANIRRKTKQGAMFFEDEDSRQPKQQMFKRESKGFLDDTIDDFDAEPKPIKKPQPPQNQKVSKGMFDDTFEEGDSNSSMLFPPKRAQPQAPPPAQNQQTAMRALPGLANPEGPKKPTPFNYGSAEPSQPAQKKPPALFEESYVEEESQLFPVKKMSSGAKDIFGANELDDSMSSSAKDRSFIDRQKEKNSNNHMMAMIMKGLDPGKKSSIIENEISIGDEESNEYQEPIRKEVVQPPPPPPKVEPPKPKPKPEAKLFLDDSRVEEENESMIFPSKPAPAKQVKEPTNKLFMEEDGEEEESFIFGKPKPQAQPSAPVQEKPAPQKKPFMFDADESFDDFNLPDKEKKETPPEKPKANPMFTEEPVEKPVEKPKPEPQSKPEPKSEPQSKPAPPPAQVAQAEVPKKEEPKAKPQGISNY